MYHTHAPPTRGLPVSESPASLASSPSSRPTGARAPGTGRTGTSAPQPPSKPRLPPRQATPDAARSTPSSSPYPAPPAHPAMGQTQSRGLAPPPAPTSPSATGSSVSNKLKRVLGRRKNSEDAASLFAHMQKVRERGKERDRAISNVPPSSPAAIGVAPSGASTTKNVLSGRKPPLPTPHSSLLSPAPAPPPKPAGLQAAKKTLAPPEPPLTEAHSENRGSIMPVTPSMGPALVYMQRADSGLEDAEIQSPEQTSVARVQEHVNEEASAEEQEKHKQDWRKSDATLTGYAIIRPGAAAGARTPRPVSMAESVTSTRTVVPVNKRLSALVTDAEFVMPEEDDLFGSGTNMSAAASQQSFARPERPSPASSVKAKNRRSMSLNFGAAFTSRLKSAASEPPTATFTDDWHARPAVIQRASTDTVPIALSVSPHAASGVMTSVQSGPVSPTGNIRGRLAAWTAAATASSGNRASQVLPPPMHPQRGQVPDNYSRQPTISISGGLAPAAGLAMGFGKRAVEKVGRAWNARHNGATGSGYASSSSSMSGSAPSSFPGIDPLGRAHPDKSGSGSFANLGKGKARRTPNAPSGAWSVTSSATSSSASDTNSFSTSGGPYLGRRLRDPVRVMTSGPITGGLVFGRPLIDCVRDTGVSRSASAGDHRRLPSDLDFEILGPQVLGHRLLPAIVLRSAQHLLKWGIEEEGLFRISGRATHMAKLRAEFDNGADYDLQEATPGDLDPHAVASIFKAYLRELPEPILTHELSPYFEAAMTAESNARSSEEASRPKPAVAGLPSSPKAGVPAPLRKPPSLSTLAMPTFAGIRPPSQAFLDNIASLIAGLPRENRDVLRTVADLLKETAKRSKVTKMPLSNLLLIFCPSMQMSPPLLRVLCEAEGVWHGTPRGPSTVGPSPLILDIKRDTLSSVMDIGPVTIDPAMPENNPDIEVSGPADQDQNSTEGQNSALRDQMSTSDDASSSFSLSDVSHVSPSSSGDTTLDSSFPHAALSSAESLGPSTPLEEPPFSRPAIPCEEKLKQPFPKALPPSPLTKVSTDRRPTRPRPQIATDSVQGPDPFGSPATTLSRRRSSPFLSLPSLHTDESDSPKSASKPSPRAARMKRPSLTLLFSKRSIPSLHSASPSTSSGWHPSPSSAQPSPALSTATAPPSIFSPPPQLCTNIDTTPLRLGLDLSPNVEPGEPRRLSAFAAGDANLSSLAAYSRSTSASSDTEKSYSSALSVAHDSPQSSTSARVGPYNTLKVNLRDEAGEDWTQSVLLAADAGGSNPSVKDVVRAFEGRGAP